MTGKELVNWIIGHNAEDLHVVVNEMGHGGRTSEAVAVDEDDEWYDPELYITNLFGEWCIEII